MEPVKTIEGYCTKYALTTGVEKVKALVGSSGEYVYEGRRQMKIGADFFVSKEDAEAAAMRMAERKIASLKKQLDKMRALSACPMWKGER